MPSSTLPNLTNLATPQPTMLLYSALSPFGATDDRKITANALFQEITQNISDLSVQFGDGDGTATVSAAGKGKIRYNDTTKTFQFSADGAAYAEIGGNPAAPVNSVQYNNAGAFGGNAGFLYDPTSSPNALITAANNAHIALSVVSGAAPSVNIFQVSADAGVTQHLFVDSSGNTTVDGKLTVTGAIDPTSIRLSSGTNLYYESADGQTAAVSAANEGRIRYNQPTQTWQASMNGAAYVNLATGAGMAIGGTVTGGTTGSVLFVGAGPVLAQDNANLFWDDSNNRLGIGTAAPSVELDLVTTANVGYGARVFVNNSGAASVPFFRLQADSRTYTMGVGSSAYTDVGVRNAWFMADNTGGVYRLVLSSAGNFGVGNFGASSPTTIIHAERSTNGTEAISVINLNSGNLGIAGYVLQSDARAYTIGVGSTNQAVTSWRGSWFVHDSTAGGAAGTRILVDSSGNIGFNALSFGTSAVAVISIGNGTAPSTSPADLFQLWSADSVAGDANAFARNEAGEINRLTGLACRVSAQFDSVDTTLANITGLSRNVEASRVYAFTAVLQTVSDVAAGVKFAIAGTATATSIAYEAVVFQGGVAVATGTQRATALGTTVGDVTAVTTAYVVITGTIVVNAAGTLTVQFAQNVDTGTSSVLINSSFALTAIS